MFSVKRAGTIVLSMALMTLSLPGKASGLDPISLLSDYAVVVSGNVSGNGAIGNSGGLLVGGDLTGSTTIYGGGQATISGDVSGNITNWNGQTSYGGALSGNATGGAVSNTASTLSSEAAGVLSDYSRQLLGLNANSTQGIGVNGWDPGVATFSTAADHTGLAVFNIVDAAQFFERTQNINFQLSDGTSSVLVNVSGSDALTINAGFWNSNAVAGNIIWNFADATEIDFLGQNFYGTILAMNADVSNSNQFYGSIAARNLLQSGQINGGELSFDAPYMGAIGGSVAAVPVPASLPLLLSGLIGFTALRHHAGKKRREADAAAA